MRPLQIASEGNESFAILNPSWSFVDVLYTVVLRKVRSNIRNQGRFAIFWNSVIFVSGVVEIQDTNGKDIIN